MDNIDERINKRINKRIKQINKQLSKIEKKNNDMCYLETVNYASDAIDASFDFVTDDWNSFSFGDYIKKGFLKPFSLTFAISDAIENLAEFGAYAAIPIALLGILFVPCAFIDLALTPVCWFHNFVTMLPGHLLVNAIIEHRNNKLQKKFPEVQKVIDNLILVRENLRDQKEIKVGRLGTLGIPCLYKEKVVVEKELKQKEKSTTDLENMSGTEIVKYIVKSRKAKQSNSKKADSEMEM